jgi:CBS domain-containing protein
VVSGVAQAFDELATLEVRDVMTRELVMAREDEPIESVLKRMRRQGVRRVPICGPAGGLVGILALDDVLEFFAEQLEDVVGLVFREQQLEQELRS